MIYVSLFFVSLSLLALEIAWMRLLSFQQWSHVASTVISLAMLGFAASGSYLALLQPAVRRGWRRHYGLLALLYAGSIPWAYFALERLPLDPFMLVWDLRQGLYLLAYSFFLFFPFLLGAASVGLLFCAEELAVGRVYFVNLFGSGLGVLTALGLLFVCSLQASLCVISLTGLLGAFLALPALRGRRRDQWGLALAAILSLSLIRLQPIRISPNKPLARTLKIPSVTETDRRTSPWGIVDVLEGPSLRSLPGLSLRYSGEVPSGSVVFLDGDSIGFRISAATARKESLDFFAQTLPAIGYEVLEAPDVLVLGAGGGTALLQALWEGAASVTLVEPHPVLLEQTRNWLQGFLGERFPGQEVICRMADARRFLQDHRGRFDLITLEGLGSPAASFSGAGAFQGDYLLTIEGLGDLLDHLCGEQGVLSFTFWTHMPPRETFKLISTLVEVYRRRGIADPSGHLFVVRGWSTCTTLAFRSPLSDRTIQTLRSFCTRNDFDLVYYPGMGPGEANRRHRLERPFYHEGVTALLGERAASFLKDYPFFIRAALDTKPYFHRFFRWETFPVLWKAMGGDWILLREWGYLALWLTFLSSLVLGGLFLLPPMLLAARGRASRRAHSPEGKKGRFPRFLFFGCLGSAFMCYEVLLIEETVFFLSYPLLSAAVIVSAILIFSSLGSLFTDRWLRKGTAEGALRKSCFGLAAVGGLYAIGLMGFFRLLLAKDLLLRGIIAFLLLAPLCFLMGVPFPAGLTWVRKRRAEDVPLCWGVNGWASVVFATLTPLLAVHMGFAGALWAGAGLYLLAGCLAVKMADHRSGSG